MTAWGSVDLAVEAMRRGARDFIQKPWDNERLLSILRTQVELARAPCAGASGSRPRTSPCAARRRRRSSPTRPSMQPVLQLIERVGPSDANVLITGENGTGKSLVAQALHAVSPRAGRPMVTVNVGGLPEGVFESELFGHVKGAFTDAKTDRVGRFELADGGTLFLDEIANIGAGPAGEAAARARDRRVRARRLVAHPPGRTSGSSRPPTPTCPTRSRQAASARTCCSG